MSPRRSTASTPWIRIALLPLLTAALLGAASQTTHAADPAPNTLTSAEQQAGWRLLFDGASMNQWRSFRKPDGPTRGWVVTNATLRHVGQGRGGDLVTREKFTQYEFRFDWTIEATGNSGVKYFITEDRTNAIGHEYQILGGVEAARTAPKHQIAGFYDVLPPVSPVKPRPDGEWNESRIVVHRQAVEHWLNGAMVLRYELGSPAVKDGIAQSKFRDVAGFGTAFPHHLLLQDHGGDVSFRNLKIRPLP